MTPSARLLVSAALLLPALLLPALLTSGQEPECPDGAACAAPTVAQATPSTPIRAGFGGVLEVRFVHDDAAAQDVVAHACGLAPSVASPLPPDIRWYPLPDDVDVAMTCLQRDPSVRRVTQPL